MVDYNDIFLQKTGQMDAAVPWDDTKIGGFLDNSAFLFSRSYATPWTDFDSVPLTYKYPVTLYAAIEYWWAKASESASKTDMAVGTNTGNKTSTLFDRALRMITVLTRELEELDIVVEGSGDILVGDLLIRSKETGYIIPRTDDPAGNWRS